MKALLLTLILFSFLQSNAQTQIGVETSAAHYPLNIVQSNGSIQTIPVSDMKGKVIVLQWWASRCKGSESNLILFEDISKKFKDKALFYAVSYDRLENIHTFQQKNKFHFDFLRDKIQWANEYFSTGPASHVVIIDSLGKCLYRGHPSVLNDELMNYLISNNDLPQKLKNKEIDRKAFKDFHNNFKIADRTSGFKAVPYSPIIKGNPGTWSTGRSFYYYNAPIYDLYRAGLFLSDYQIKIPDSLRNRLSSKETSNLYSVGFQLEKTDYGLRKYSSTLADSLNKAFHLNAKFTSRPDSVIVIKSIKESKSITKSLLYNINYKKLAGDTIMVKGQNTKNLCAVMSSYMNMTFVTDSRSNTTYDGNIILDLNSTSRAQVQAQLARQGIESEVKLQKNTAMIEWKLLRHIAPTPSLEISYLATGLKNTLIT